MCHFIASTMWMLPEGASLKEYINNFAQMVDVLAGKQEESGVKLLWGTANCFTNPRYGAGAATNPDRSLQLGGNASCYSDGSNP